VTLKDSIRSSDPPYHIYKKTKYLRRLSKGYYISFNAILPPEMAAKAICNALIYLDLWMCYSVRCRTEKILFIIPPIAYFVAAGSNIALAEDLSFMD
jgi:hypothetical protein